MKIAIDCRMLGKSGIGVYLENILEYILKQNIHTFLLIGSKQQLAKYGSHLNCSFLYTDIPIFSLKELFFFNVSEINRCDVYYSPNYNFPLGIKIPVYLTIHDVVFLDIPSLVSILGKWIRYTFFKRAVRCTKVLFTVSDFSKDRIKSHFNIKSPIVVTYNGITKNLLSYKKSSCRPFPFEYFLFVGNIKAHKGINVLLEAYQNSCVRGETRKLVIVGEYQNFRTRDKQVGAQIASLLDNKQNIIFTGKLSDERLYDIYAYASVLIQPSLYEGFGIPPLEAMFLNTPVIISDIPVFKEIYRDFPVHFFKSNSVDSLTNLMMTVQGERLNLSKNLAERFNYADSANLILNNLKR